MPDDDGGQAGRPVDPGSHRSRIERGEARQMSVVIADETYRQLKVHAALTDRTMSEMVEEAVTEWLEARKD